MKNQKRIMLIGSIAAVVIALVVVTIVLINRYTPSKEVMPLTDYMEVASDEATIVFHDGYYEKKAMFLDGQVYVDFDTVKTKFNPKFYWDNTENLLIYTTSVSVIKATAGDNFYRVNKSKTDTGYQIVKTTGSEVYVALDYIKLFSNIDYRFYEEPNRVYIDYEWGNDYLYSAVQEDTQVRFKPDIKSEILEEVKVGDRLLHIDTSETIEEDFIKVMTEDGIIGYAREKYLKDGEYETLTSDYVQESYSHILKDEKINMVFHQVFSTAENDEVLNELNVTKGVTTICPTWFTVIGEQGELSSLASENYVERAHNAGVEVWALVTDIAEDPVDMSKLLPVTSRREKLINELVSYAIKLNLDGLNIDFENVPARCGEDFIQFLRELSVKCRNNGIILSVDNFVPTEYTAFYNRKEQGEIVDYVVVMAYDEHYGGSEEAGSTSSISWVQQGIDKTLEEVPKEQVIIAIPFYTRLWEEEKKKNGEIELSSSAYGMYSSLNLIEDYGVTPKWDSTLKQNYAEFPGTNAEGKEVTYKIWLEDDKSIEAKMQAIEAAEVAGVAEWKLGIEKESVWDIILKYVN